ncbi:hypothetical protein BB559_005839 [Furculomyces boomerangus]|uniref:Rab-GAP TBC domain-containing protein n=1 Tax=Furculomyces boomerangus TaxID=61424 RepID=A0A2T9Y6B5_9FUNG|nr:hypothetical protein BB559_005839 [Furculomyces boomerangus]
MSNLKQTSNTPLQNNQVSQPTKIDSPSQSDSGSGYDSDNSKNELGEDDLILARIELANAMFNLDPKAIVIQDNEIRTNSSTLRSLKGNTNQNSLKKNSPIKTSETNNLNSTNSNHSPTQRLSSNRNRLLIDDKETMLSVKGITDSDDDLDNSVPRNFRAVKQKSLKASNKQKLLTTKKDSTLSIDAIETKNIKSEPLNNTNDFGQTDDGNSNSDLPSDNNNSYYNPEDDCYGENKIPQFIREAKCMKDIDLITDSWEQTLKLEPEGAFWSSLINDLNAVKRKTPHLVSSKIRNGIPPKLRGVVWQALSHGRSTYLQTMYYQLVKEHSPHERIILRDLPRTFPALGIFKDINGEGQKRLFNILKAYSLYDAEVGYCQGLGFVIGPLMMNMSECEAFCVLVRLMETYDLRGMFTEDMDGLHLRLFQFSTLAQEVLPQVWDHFQKHNIYPAMYAASWFLSLFAYALPLGFVLRVMDVLLYEGAAETIIRIGITLLSRNAQRLLAKNDFESLMNILSSKLYRSNSTEDQPRVILNEANLLTNVVTSARLKSLSEEYYKKIGKPEKISGNLQSTSTTADKPTHGARSSVNKKNKTIMNLLGLSWFDSQKRGTDADKEQSFSSETKIRARKWLNDMQNQQSLVDKSNPNTDDITGFDFLTLSGFETTRGINNESSSNRSSFSTSISSPENKSEYNYQNQQETENLNNNSGIQTKKSFKNEININKQDDSSNKDILDGKKNHTNNSTNNSTSDQYVSDFAALSLNDNVAEDAFEPIRRQLHDARVTADTNLHALASLRAEHELVLTKLAQVKLDRAEMESYVEELKRTIKTLEAERYQLSDDIKKTEGKLEQTETALIKSRLKLADSEDKCFNLKEQMDKASDYIINKSARGVDKTLINMLDTRKIIDTSPIKFSFGENISNDSKEDIRSRPSNITETEKNTNLESPKARTSSIFSVYSKVQPKTSISFARQAEPPKKAPLNLDLSSGTLFPKRSNTNPSRSPFSPHINGTKNLNVLPSPNKQNFSGNISRQTGIRAGNQLDLRRLSKANFGETQKHQTHLDQERNQKTVESMPNLSSRSNTHPSNKDNYNANI